MAIRYDRDNNDFTHVGVPFNYTRGNPLPLDNSSVWTSKAAAEEYAKSSPVAYVGQLLTIAAPTDLVATVWIIADAAGSLVQIGKRENCFKKLEPIGDYLYEIEFTEDYDYTDALAYFADRKPVADTGACTTIRNGNLVGRNLDWTYNNKAEFVIRSRKTNNRHASIGLAGNVNALTNDVVKSRAYSPYYYVVPFLTVDGINDAGVFVSSHVVPSGDYGKTTGTNPTASVTLCNYMVPRYILDNFSTAKEAVEYIRDNVNVYCALKDTTNTEECAYFVADATETYLVEFINNSTRVIHLDGSAVSEADKLPTWETNFYRTNKDDSTSNIVMQELNTVDYTASKITLHGMGIERWNYIAGEYSTMTTAPKMMKALKNLWYSSVAYSTTNVYSAALSEFVEGSLTLETIEEDRSAFQDTLDAEVAKFHNRSRDPESENFGTWWTMHSCVYNFDTKELWVINQEDSLKKSVFRMLDDSPVEHDHSHAFIECWDMTNSNSSVASAHMTPTVRAIDLVNYSGYYDSTTNRFLYLNNGIWYMYAPNEVTGSTAIGGGKYSSYLAIENFPISGNIAYFKRGQSNQEDDRLLTTKTGIFDGDVVFRGTTSTDITDGSHTSPITVAKGDTVITSYTPSGGDMVLYNYTDYNKHTGQTETYGVLYVWDGVKVTVGASIYAGTWHEYGDLRRFNLMNLTGMAFAPKAKATYTPAGTISTPSISVELNTAKLDNLKIGVNGESVDFTSDEVTFATSVKSASATQPTFTGTQADIVSDPHTPTV